MPTNVDEALAGILGAAAGALESAGAGTALVHLAPGTAEAWDNCCSGDGGHGGQLFLRVVDVYPSAPFPDLDRSQRQGGLLAVHAALGVIRCAATLDDNGAAPSAAEMTGDALSALDDMALLYGVLHGLKVPGVASVKLGRWTPKGVSGGCAGGEWELWLAFNNLCYYYPESDGG